MSSKKLLIQIFSDLHIELWNKFPELPTNAKYLFLAGDICNQTHPLFYPFFDYCSSKWEKVFYVPGNHEFYIKKKNYNELSFEYKYKLSERYKNVFYLDNEFAALDDDVNVYGTTFWTKPPFINTYEARMCINDYNWISYFDKTQKKVVNLDINYVKELSNNSFNELQSYLNKTDKKTIVMTHFPPLMSGTSDPKYLLQKRTSNFYFSWPDNTLEKLKLNNTPVWISGHTHWSYDFKIYDTRFIGNQLGYKTEVETTGLKEDGLYEIEVIS
jgi:predicted phosphodiesterase